MFAEVPLPDKINGKVAMMIKGLTAGAGGLETFNARADIQKGRVILKALATPLDNINALVDITEAKVGVPDITLNIGRGTVKANAGLDDYLSRPRYRASMDMQGLDIAELVDQKDFPVKVEGKIFGALQVQGEGFDPAVMANALTGNGNMEIKEGKLTDINILKLVLDKITIVPNFRQRVEENLPERFKDKLKQKDTILTQAKLAILIGQGKAAINPLNVEADGFLFEGTGEAGFDLRYNFDGTFMIPQDLSLSMANIVPELEYLYDGQGQIIFPLKVSGQGADIRFMPDMEYIITNAVKNKGRQELQKVLDKVFGKESETPPAATPAPPQREKDPTQILIEGVLDSIFK